MNVAMSLNCIITLSDRLLGRERRPQQATPSEGQEVAGDTSSEATGEMFLLFPAQSTDEGRFLKLPV